MEIKLSGLSKQFEDQKDVLHAMDFSDDVRALAVIGPSGGGKSTLLRILGGLIAPTTGQVQIGGEEVHYESTEIEAHRKKIGYVFQQGGLFKHMSAMDNIVIPLVKVHGYTREQAVSRAENLLKRFDLLADAGKKPAALSGGQQQRVAIARAIAAKPGLLLLDEPTSALDPEYTTEVLDMIKELKDERLDFIIVTHEMGFARHACEKVLFLCEGRLVEYGNSDTIFQQPETDKLKRFLGKLLEWNI